MLLVIVFLLIFLSWLLFFNGVQSASTSKSVYSQGEKVLVFLSDFKVYRCSCWGAEVEFYRKIGNEWKVIEKHPPLATVSCVNGKAELGPFPCDVVWCGFDFSISKWNYTWDSTIYERKGETGTCEVPEGLGTRFPIPAYEKITAPSGLYKVKFGLAEKNFEIE